MTITRRNLVLTGSVLPLGAADAVKAQQKGGGTRHPDPLSEPLTFPDADGFLTSTLPDETMVGRRASTQDGMAAWDIVPDGTGDFDHPITGVGVKVVAMARSWATAVLVDYAPLVNGLLRLGTEVSVPAGRFPIKSQITVPPEGVLHGTGSRKSTLVKDGSFTGLLINDYTEVIGFTLDGTDGNGGDGIQLIGGRNDLRNITISGQGGRGLVIGRNLGDVANTNLWRVTNITSMMNASHGVDVSDDANPSAPDVNAGIAVGLDLRQNGGDGLHLGSAIDNQFVAVCSQRNAGWGVNLAGSGENHCAGNYITAPYTEGNEAGDLLLSPMSRRNYIFGVRSQVVNLVVTNLGTDNMVIDRAGSTNTMPRHAAPEAFEDLRLIKAGTAGLWQWIMDPEGNLTLSNNSGGHRDVLMTGGRGLFIRQSTDHVLDSALRAMRTGRATLDFGMVPAGAGMSVLYSSADFVDIDQAKWLVTATPDFDPPVGLTWSVAFLAATSNIRLTVHNSEASAIDLSISDWIIRAIKISATV